MWPCWAVGLCLEGFVFELRSHVASKCWEDGACATLSFILNFSHVCVCVSHLCPLRSGQKSRVSDPGTGDRCL